MSEDYVIQLVQRPTNQVADEIVSLVRLLSPEWFTPDVPEDTRRDLLFQDAFCLRQDEKLLSCVVFTCWDGALNITLFATHPDYRGQGWGSMLMRHFANYARQLGFKHIVVLTVPPDTKPVYQATLQFYQKHGFVLTKRIENLWGSGSLKLVKTLE